MKILAISTAAAVSLVLAGSAFAQAAPAGQAPMAMPSDHMAMAPMTRADVVQRVQKHFAMLDTNKDGFLTKAELQQAHGAMHSRGHAGMEGDPGAMFDRLDANHDGSITRDEFNAAHQAMAQRMGNGGDMAMHQGGMRGHMAERMFGTADANNDGKVSLQEATAVAAAHFDRADTNHDGTLSADEMRAAHQAMRGKTGR
jgi:Ca2+-binding EF-hand superfamily protein